MTILADAASTDGRISVVDCHAPGRSGPPLHRHDSNETFLVHEGEVAFVVDGAIQRCGPGELAHVPGGAAHTFWVLSDEARMTVICNPAGHEELFRHAGGPAQGDGLPPRPDGPPDIGLLMRAAAAAGATILGPPPADLVALEPRTG